MDGACNQCVSVLKLQGIIAAASFAACLYTCCRTKRSRTVQASAQTVPDVIPQTSRQHIEYAKPAKVAMNKVKLPKHVLPDTGEMKMANSKVLVQRLLSTCKEMENMDLEVEVEKQSDTEANNHDQCTAALAYEFAGVFGSEKVQQADATRIITALGKITELRYIESIVLLGCIDPTVIKAFDPLIVLAVLCLMPAHKDKIPHDELYAIFEDYKINLPMACGAATAIKCSVDCTRMGPDEVTQVLNVVKAAATRRSSRIRKAMK
ncbi:lambda family phage portal protein, putative [Babesia ovis]|uniref:Lambda family phage portal protein, putative n=1 Tax=Babesia ovis TaxID=5869 RepID=A0A9W5TAS6_BABOV|nr:lambda family phage portal protein, putative [Babesia ovis]